MDPLVLIDGKDKTDELATCGLIVLAAIWLLLAWMFPMFGAFSAVFCVGFLVGAVMTGMNGRKA